MSGAIQRWMEAPVLEAVQKLKPLAEQAGCSLAQFALAWVLREPNVASAIVGRQPSVPVGRQRRGRGPGDRSGALCKGRSDRGGRAQGLAFLARGNSPHGIVEGHDRSGTRVSQARTPPRYVIAGGMLSLVRSDL